MPSVSKKQHNFMAAVANNPKFAKKAGVPSAVGKEFLEADEGKKFRSGGFTNPARGKFNKPRSNHGMMQLPNFSLEKQAGKKTGGILTNTKETDMKKMNPGMMAIMAKRKDMPMKDDMKKSGMAMKKGGMPMVMKDGKKVPAFAADGMGKMAKGGMAMKKPAKKMMMGGMAKGGGIEIKGKTKGTMIGMKKGGKACK